MPWVLTEPPVDAQYFPDAPEGDFLTLRGTCVPQGRYAGYYKHVEDEICGREITVVVQCTITDDTNGIRVWSALKDGSWGWHGSHFKNTLLADPDFDALISPLLIDQSTPDQ